MLTQEYQIKIRQCPLEVRQGGTGADSGKDIVYVDWRPILAPNDPNRPLESCEFELGWDPTAQPPAWVEDASMRYAPAPVWARSEIYIQALEARVAELEGEATPK